MLSFALMLIGIIVFVPLVGGLLAGTDRIVTARMQGRQGPPLLQPFYDVFKLWQKETTEVNPLHRFYIYVALLFAAFSTTILLSGGNILLAIFVHSIGAVFFVLGGYATGNSPYSTVGAERELLQMMAYEPMLLLTGTALYYTNSSFFVSDIVAAPLPAVLLLPGVFLGLLFILTFQLRKSPFDLSSSHHGHQEIVKGITTEFTGRDLAIVEVLHWYETVIALTFVAIFFVTAEPFSYLVAALACLAAYFLEIIIDNAFARTKWQFALVSAWVTTGVLGIGNLFILSAFLR